MFLAVALLSALAQGPGEAVETMRIHMGSLGHVVSLRGRELVWADGEDDNFVDASQERAVVEWKSGKLLVDGKASESGNVRFRTRADAGLYVKDRWIQGELWLGEKDGNLQPINVIPLEDYLLGVLAGEMPKSFPLEALRAQAVAARTYALQRKLRALDAEFHLGSDVLSQVYRGLQATDEKVRQAVQSTKGLVLTYDMEPIEAYFHSSCGGQTETGLHALGRDLPYLQSVECPCARLPNTHWTARLKKSEMASLFRAKRLSVEVKGRSSTGRVQRLETSTGKAMTGTAFREKLGYSRVKSLQFEWVALNDAYELRGRGFGHGAGLCQWGARERADAGWNFEQILQHYYPGTALQTLY